MKLYTVTVNVPSVVAGSICSVTNETTEATMETEVETESTIDEVNELTIDAQCSDEDCED